MATKQLIVNRLRPNVTRIEGVFFYPSLNTITDEAEIKRVQASQAFKNMIDAGIMEIVEQTAEEKVGNTLVDSVASVSIPKAIGFIKDSINKADLKLLAETDERVGVKNAVAEHLEDLEARENAQKTEKTGSDEQVGSSDKSEFADGIIA